MEKYSRIYAKIDLDAVEYNFESMRRNIHPDTKMIAVIKADAYGHGAVPIARLMEPRDYLWGFAVATAEEAFALRRAGIRKPILVLGFVFEEHYPGLVTEDIRPVVFKKDMAEKLSQEADRQGKILPVHIGLDTGMTRIGFCDTPESADAVLEISGYPGLQVEGLFTHFARADETDKTFANRQFERYNGFLKLLEERGLSIPLRHCSNSAGIIDMPWANLDAVRAGISIYGIYPSEEVKKQAVPLKPVMELKSHISYIKDVEAGVQISYGGTFETQRKSRIATIPVGYADGYPRLLSNRGRVLIGGMSAPIVGRICMDQFMVDVTDIPARELDEVTLLGENQGLRITAEELGDISGRFPYELVCDITKRVPRVFVKNRSIAEQKDYFHVY